MHILFAATISEGDIHNVHCARMLVGILAGPSNMLVNHCLCAMDLDLMAQPHNCSTNGSIHIPS